MIRNIPLVLRQSGGKSTSTLRSSMNDKTIIGGNSRTITMSAARASKIAIVGGGGAAGLAAARALQKYSSSLPIVVTVLEKSHSIGGVWNYKNVNSDEAVRATETKEQEEINGTYKKLKKDPMYQNLRTNLPKEIMAFQEFPWPELVSSSSNRSFVTHQEVFDYLKEYATRYNLENSIHYGCTVSQLSILNSDDDNKTTKNSLNEPMFEKSNISSNEKLPKIQLQWKKTKSGAKYNEKEDGDMVSYHSDVFDAVVVCNGHYSKPAMPTIPGVKDYFRGSLIHSVQYDKPDDFLGQTVLLIGARASGSDIAREIASYQEQHPSSTTKRTQHVYLSDSTYKNCEPITKYGVTLVPRTKAILSDGRVQFDCDCNETPLVDTIIFCSGYDYDFPFVNENSNIQLSCTNRCVTPLYEQLWHATYPNLAFIGLPHSVIPFPLFGIQAEAIAYQWLAGRDTNDPDQVYVETKGNASTNPTTITVSVDDPNGTNYGNEKSSSDNVLSLPNRIERENSAKIDANSGGPEPNGRIPQDTHYLGSHQWDYCRTISKYANLYNSQMERYLQTNKVCDHRVIISSRLIDSIVLRVNFFVY